MKVQAGQVDRFVDHPAEGVVAILLYGPDQGLVDERAKRAMKRIVEDLNDPFHVAEFVAEELRESPAKLFEEAQAMSLMGGRRVVRMRQAGDSSTIALQALFDLPRQEAFLIVEAGELPPASSLRRLFEKSEKTAALACYQDDSRVLADVIRSTLRQAGMTIEPDAMRHLQTHLGSDRELTRGELAKLVLYMSSNAASPISVEDVDAVIGDSSALMMDDFVWSVLAGETGKAETALARLLAEGRAPVSIVRALSSTLMRLLPMRIEVEAGKAPAQVVAAARPPIYFRRKDVTQRVVERRPARMLTKALAMVFETEQRCKTTGLPDRLMLQRLCGRLSSLLAGAST